MDTEMYDYGNQSDTWSNSGSQSSGDVLMEDAESPPSGHPPIEEPVLASNPSPTSSRPVRMDGSSRESQKQSFGDLSQIYMTADSDEARTLSYVAPSQETLKSIVDAISGLGNENEPHWVDLQNGEESVVHDWEQTVGVQLDKRYKDTSGRPGELKKVLDSKTVTTNYHEDTSTLAENFGEVLGLARVPTWQAASDIISEWTNNAPDHDYLSALNHWAAEGDNNAKLRGTYHAAVLAYDASIIKRLDNLLQHIYADETVVPPLSDFLRYNLIMLFGDTLVDSTCGLRHRRRWAKRTLDEQVQYVRDLIKCLQNDPQDDSLVTKEERQALDELEAKQGWSGRKGKAPMPH